MIHVEASYYEEAEKKAFNDLFFISLNLFFILTQLQVGRRFFFFFFVKRRFNLGQISLECYYFVWTELLPFVYYQAQVGFL